MHVSILDYAEPSPVTYSQEGSSLSPWRSTVVIAGTKALPKEWHCDLSTFGIADTATIVVPVVGNPDWSVSLVSANWNDPLPIEIYVGSPAQPGQEPTLDGMTRLFLGGIDQYSVEFHADECRFQARSFAAILIDDRITTFATSGTAPAFPGQIVVTAGMTTFAFLGAVAKQYGLTLDLAPAKGQKPLLVTQIYARNYMVGMQNVSPWDIIKDCAQIEDMQVWVDSNSPSHDGSPTLHYVSPINVPQQRKTMVWGSDLKTFTGTHSPTFNKEVNVTVRTYSDATRVSYTTRTSVSADGTVTNSSSQRTATTVPVFGTNMSTLLSSGTTTTASGTSSNTSANTSSKTGGLKTGTFNASTPKKTSKQSITLRLANLTQEQADFAAKIVSTIISRYEFTADFSFAVTPDLLPYLNVRTLWFITGLPWNSFNTPQGPQTAPPLASANPTIQAALAQIQANDPSWSTRAYRSHTLSLSFVNPQGDGGGDTGFEATVSGPNHPILVQNS